MNKKNQNINQKLVFVFFCVQLYFSIHRSLEFSVTCHYILMLL